MAARRHAPHHRDHRRRAAQRRLLRAAARPAAGQEDGQLRRARRLPPLLRRRAGHARLDPDVLRVPRREPGRAGDGMVHTIQWRVAPRRAGLLGRRLGDAGVAAERDGAALRFADSEGLAPRAARRRRRRRAAGGARRRTSRPSTRCRASMACARTPRAPERSAAPARRARLRRARGRRRRTGASARRRAPRRCWPRAAAARARAHERRDDPPRRVVGGRRRRAASPTAPRAIGRRRPRDRHHRPPVLPLGLLPRAQRRALRARLARHRLRVRRAGSSRSARR